MQQELAGILIDLLSLNLLKGRNSCLVYSLFSSLNLPLSRDSENAFE